MPLFPIQSHAFLDVPNILIQLFANKDMREIQLQFVFKKCFEDAQTLDGTGNAKGLELGSDGSLMHAINKLERKYSFDSQVKGDRALCHGDLHPGSGMFP